MQLAVASLVILVSYAHGENIAPCGGRPADVFFVLDSSGSISLQDFRKELQFTEDVAAMFDIGPSATRVGVISFSKTVRTQFDLGQYDNRRDMLSKIANVTYEGLGTNTAEALSYLHVKGMTPEQLRPGLPHIAIVLTDGQSQDSQATLRQAEIVHRTGITVFVIGIGSQVDRHELSAIASQPTESYMFMISSFDALEHIKEELAIKACEVTPAPDVKSPEEEVEKDLLSHGSCSPRHPLDIVFAIDTAGIGASNTKFVLQFVGNISDHISMDGSQTSIATIGSGCSGGTFEEESATDAVSVRKGLSSYQTPEFDHMVRNMRIKAADGRSDSAHIGIIFLSDQLSPYTFKKASLEVRRAMFQRTTVFVVGVGDRLDETQARSLVTQDGEFVKAMSFDTLRDAGTPILYKLCVFGASK